MNELKKQLNKQLNRQLYITPLISFEEIENDNDLMDTISAWAIDGGDHIPIYDDPNDPNDPNDTTYLDIE